MCFTYGNSINVWGKKKAQVGGSDRENIMQLTRAIPAFLLSENMSQREREMGKVNLLFLFLFMKTMCNL